MVSVLTLILLWIHDSNTCRRPKIYIDRVYEWDSYHHRKPESTIRNTWHYINWKKTRSLSWIQTEKEFNLYLEIEIMYGSSIQTNGFFYSFVRIFTPRWYFLL